jgi:hypothetical protein
VASTGLLLVGGRNFWDFQSGSISLTSLAYQPGQGGSYPYNPLTYTDTGDDVYAIVELQDSTVTCTASAGWTLIYQSTWIGRFQVWHYGLAPSSTWADFAPTFTVSAAVNGRATAFSVRGDIVDSMQFETLTATTSSPYTVTPTLNAATTSNVYVAGYIYGSEAGSGGAQSGPDYYPTGSSLNGWTEVFGNSQFTYGGGWHGNQGSLPATLPTFSSTNGGRWGWLVMSIRKTPDNGWSVGRIKY